jgi:hypothetical protein
MNAQPSIGKSRENLSDLAIALLHCCAGSGDRGGGSSRRDLSKCRSYVYQMILAARRIFRDRPVKASRGSSERATHLPFVPPGAG